jgi:hypothetical protein
MVRWHYPTDSLIVLIHIELLFGLRALRFVAFCNEKQNKSESLGDENEILLLVKMNL